LHAWHCLNELLFRSFQDALDTVQCRSDRRIGRFLDLSLPAKDVSSSPSIADYRPPIVRQSSEIRRLMAEFPSHHHFAHFVAASYPGPSVRGSPHLPAPRWGPGVAGHTL